MFFRRVDHPFRFVPELVDRLIEVSPNSGSWPMGCETGCTVSRAMVEETDGRAGTLDQGIATLWASSLAVLGTLGGTLGGAWVQRKAAVLQVREEAGAQNRARLWEERRAVYARVLDRCDDSHAAFAQVWELHQEAVGGAPLTARPGPVRDAASQELQRTLTELRRAVAHVLPLGPQVVARQAETLSKKQQQRVERVLGPTNTLEEMRAELAGLEEQYHMAYGAFATAARGVLAPD
ncbi:hypothetical protein [Streptomyces sp. NBC_01012]|uniref:hypothetical protein n=1 Tax=Streptomyces sp. NBC_01012 TaxID=2903717 RepID=UPI0038703636|nr:hypothetical protein OG623_04985 [Streptomyces sp. NBC_01012]